MPLKKMGENIRAQAGPADAVSPLPPGVDPSQVDTWHVRVNDAFYHASTNFMPGPDYYVSPDVYNSKLDNGTSFISHCGFAQPQLKV